MSAIERISRLGRLLGILASSGQAVLIIGWTFVFLVLGAITGEAEGFSQLTPYNIIPNLASLLLAGTQFWVLQKLFRIGQTLQVNQPISLPLADGFRRLGHAILICGIATFLHGWEPVIRDGRPALGYKLEFDIFALFMVGIACVCAHCIAKVLTEAVKLREENEGFV